MITGKITIHEEESNVYYYYGRSFYNRRPNKFDYDKEIEEANKLGFVEGAFVKSKISSSSFKIIKILPYEEAVLSFNNKIEIIKVSIPYNQAYFPIYSLDELELQ